MEPTIYLSISIYYFLVLYLVPIKFLISRYKKKEKIVVGKVRVAKAVGILILYIGRIRFVILEKGKRITERKEIN